MQQKEHKIKKHSSPEFRLQENVQKKEHMTQKHRCDVFKINEKEKEKYCKVQKRTSDDFRDEENAQKRARTQTSTYGNNLDDSINIFLDAVSQGPINVCSSCLQTEFASNVVDVSTLHPGIHQSLLKECLTQETSIDGKEWLCLSCK